VSAKREKAVFHASLGTLCIRMGTEPRRTLCIRMGTEVRSVSTLFVVCRAHYHFMHFSLGIMIISKG